MVAFTQNWGILQAREDQKGEPQENDFWPFSNIEMNITNS